MNQGIPWQLLHYLICIITRGLCSYNVRLSDDDITAIRVSYWWRREFSNFSVSSWLNIKPCTSYYKDNTRMGLERHQYALNHLPCDATITRSIPARILSTEPPSSLSLPTRRELVCLLWDQTLMFHYNDVIMSVMASQITSLMIVYSVVYSGTEERKHQSCASLALVREIHRWPVNSRHKGQ